jgi:hypothetical protein
MSERPFKESDKAYKQAFVDFIKTKQWHWFVTIPIGDCDDDDLVLKRLRRIENELCRRYLVNRYYNLPPHGRYSFAIAFEGDRQFGTRHAHILVYIPTPTKKHGSQALLINLFPSHFKDLWVAFKREAQPQCNNPPPYDSLQWADDLTAIRCTRANLARSIYTVKDVRQNEVPWSRFEFVTLPKRKHFHNTNLSVIHHRNRQRRRLLKSIDDPRVNNHVV